jgi:integrase
MATVLQRGNGKKWYAVFRDLNGKQRWVRLESTDRKSAQKAADLLEDTANRRKPAQHMRKAFADLYLQAYGQGLPVATVRQLTTLWLEQCKAEIAASSFDAYRKVVERFLDYLGEAADRDIADIVRKDLVGFRNSLAASLSSDTVNRYVKILRMVFKAAKRDGYILENPAEFVDTVRDRRETRRRPFTIAEIRSVLAVADDEWKSIVKFGLYTGQRLGDIASLTWAGIGLDREVVVLTARKTGKRITVPMAEPLKSHILSLKSSDDPTAPLHPRAYELVEKQGRANTISNQFVDLLVQTGLRQKRTHQGRGIGRGAKRESSALSFHCLRHTAVSLLKDAGVPQAVVQELIGHDSEAMSALYTHVGEESLRRAASALPEI